MSLHSSSIAIANDRPKSWGILVPKSDSAKKYHQERYISLIHENVQFGRLRRPLNTTESTTVFHERISTLANVSNLHFRVFKGDTHLVGQGQPQEVRDYSETQVAQSCFERYYTQKHAYALLYAAAAIDSPCCLENHTRRSLFTRLFSFDSCSRSRP